MYNPEDYIDCHRCGLHQTRHAVCQYRVTPYTSDLLTCDICWIGGAPSPYDNVRGLPFLDQTGHLLDSMIDILNPYHDLTHVLTNLIMCYPGREINHPMSKILDPSETQIKACAPRLTHFLKDVKPSLVILLGEATEKHYNAYQRPSFLKIPTIRITHPAQLFDMEEHVATQLFHASIADIREKIRNIQ